MIRVKRIVMKSSRVLLKNGLEKKIRSQSYKLGDATIQFKLGLHMRKVHQGELHFPKRNITEADLRFKCSENWVQQILCIRKLVRSFIKESMIELTLSYFVLRS